MGMWFCMLNMSLISHLTSLKDEEFEYTIPRFKKKKRKEKKKLQYEFGYHFCIHWSSNASPVFFLIKNFIVQKSSDSRLVYLLDVIKGAPQMLYEIFIWYKWKTSLKNPQYAWKCMVFKYIFIYNLTVKKA